MATKTTSFLQKHYQGAARVLNEMVRLIKKYPYLYTGAAEQFYSHTRDSKKWKSKPLQYACGIGTMLVAGSSLLVLYAMVSPIFTAVTFKTISALLVGGSLVSVIGTALFSSGAGLIASIKRGDRLEKEEAEKTAQAAAALEQQKKIAQEIASITSGTLRDIKTAPKITFKSAADANDTRQHNNASNVDRPKP